MKDKFIRFMQGRNGVDDLSKFSMGAALVCIILALFTRPGSFISTLLNMLCLAALIYAYFRVFSRNLQKRYEENQKYLSVVNNIKLRFRKEKNIMGQRKTNHIYTCPGCGQKIRVPRGKGKIEIDCPKCHTKFVKRS